MMAAHAKAQRRKEDAEGTVASLRAFAPLRLCVSLLPLVVAGAAHADITGKIDKPEAVKAVFALLREEKPVTYPAKVDAKTGEFTIAGLPKDKTFDLVVEHGAARLEGVNLKVPKSDFVDGDPPLTKADEEKLRATMKRLNVFEDTHEFLAIGGNVQHAAVFINKLRTKPFYESKPGEVIWRCETWFFEREEPEDAWVKVQDTLFIVHYRERLQKADYDKKSITFDPKLGGLDANAKLGTIALPDAKPGIRIRNAPVNPDAKKED